MWKPRSHPSHSISLLSSSSPPQISQHVADWPATLSASASASTGALTAHDRVVRIGALSAGSAGCSRASLLSAEVQA